MKSINLLLFVMFAAGGILALGFIGPQGAALQSVAQGNVYDIYKTTPAGVTTQVASCQPFSQILADQNADPNNNYSGNPDSKCGPIVIVTSTTIDSTTFTNAGAPTTCPPPGAPSGYAYVCNGTTITVTVTTTMNSTTTTISTITSTATTTTNVKAFASSFSIWQYAGIGISAFSLLGLVVVNRKARPNL